MTLNIKSLPESPGIYKFYSKGKIIYIGKAKNLKKRVSSYFGKSFKDRKTHQIKKLTEKIEIFSTSTEVEALLLEQSLIKENLPRFNILLRDDKTYPYVHFSMDHQFPSISMERSKHAVSKNFFGPFISAHSVKSTIKDLQKIYQLRNCSDNTFKNRSRPCIEYQMKRCSAPCVGFIGESNYLTDVISAQEHLSSSNKKTILLMSQKMEKLADSQEYEAANEVKKKIISLKLIQEEHSFDTSLDSVDFFACTSKLDRTGACILSVRDGKIRGTKTHYLKGNYLDDIDNLFQSLIFSYYQNLFSLPDKIILTNKLKNVDLIKDAIEMKFKKRITLSSKINSQSKKLSKLAILNSNQAIENKINQADKYQYAISEISSLLGSSKNLLSIEGYDVSHHSGKHGVASCVRFTNKGPEKSAYKIYNIPKALAGNDIGSLEYVLLRRIKKVNINPLPDIILIDGGKLQLEIALQVFKKYIKKLPLILSIVKGTRRVRATETILSENGVIEMPKNSAGFIFLQQIRDESHRFAILRNRKLKLKSVKRSELDSIKGIGPKKKRALLSYFKSIKAIKAASIDELCLVDGINANIAKKVYNLQN